MGYFLISSKGSFICSISQTSCGALTRTRTSSMGAPGIFHPMTHYTMSGWSTTEHKQNITTTFSRLLYRMLSVCILFIYLNGPFSFHSVFSSFFLIWQLFLTFPLPSLHLNPWLSNHGTMLELFNTQ